jgi:glutamate-1-semialdehyde 2,1-aminomutase
MKTWGKSQQILATNSQWVPGGVVSLNRKCEPNICFSHGQGSHVWDVDGNQYVDYQAGFSAFFLGHNDPDVDEAVEKVMKEKRVLMGAGPTELEGELAELICRYVPSAEKVQICNTGSEATYNAIRLARAVTGRDDILVVQGSYNGWHNDVAANVISSLKDIGPRVSPGEYPYDGLSAGVPVSHQRLIHAVNYNDLESVEFVAKKHPIACMILEPVLQNIGVVQPQPDYLKGLRKLADKYGFLLIMDEVKTGFRHAIGGYQTICNVAPDLCTFGKAIANGYPISALGGKSEYMDYFIHPEKSKRALISGTYNAHPVPTAAAIATIKKLASREHRVYEHVYKLGQMLEDGMKTILKKCDVPYRFARLGSAFCLYFMDHEPRDYHDLAENHDAALDTKYRRALIEVGIYNFPLPTKQGSISFAHTTKDIEETLEKTEAVLKNIS